MGTLPVEDVNRIVRAFEKSEWRSLHLQLGDAELYLDKNPAASVASDEISDRPKAQSVSVKPPSGGLPSGSPAGSASAGEPDVPDGWSVVTAQSLGTFYRAPKPGAPPFAEVGQFVTPETELCLVEVMKLFTTVRAGIGGTIRQIFGRDGDLVQRGQPLFLIEPAGPGAVE